MPWREQTLPTDGDWLKADEAAALESRLLGREVTKEAFRYWLRNGLYQTDKYEVRQSVTGYAIERESMLRVYEAWAGGMLARVKAEREAGDAKAAGS